MIGARRERPLLMNRSLPYVEFTNTGDGFPGGEYMFEVKEEWDFAKQKSPQLLPWPLKTNIRRDIESWGGG